jgi:hypothetical protein
MPRVLAQDTLYGETRFHAAFPSIARFSDDHLVLAFRRARDGLWLVPAAKRVGFDPLARVDHLDSRSHIALMELDPAGQQRSEGLELLPFNPEAADQDPSLLCLPDDQLFLASFSYYPLPSDIDALMRGRSETQDEQAGCRYLSWGSHASLRHRARDSWRYHHAYLRPDQGYGRALGVEEYQPTVGAVRGQPLWRDGEILLGVYWGSQEGCALFASADSGESWRYRSRIARDDEAKVAFQEPAFCAYGDTGMVCFMRTSGAGGRLATTRSTDGLQWSEPRLHALIGHPFHPLLLADGRVLLSYGYRTTPYGIRLRVLDNALADPDRAEEFVVRDDGVCADVGYPWAVELADGNVLLVYYWTDLQGRRQILGSWLEI